MPVITREDGERFVVPTYRDVLSAKKPGLLKREILLLTTNYGEYITLQKKGPTQYEVAFSPEPGALLGETVWSFFKRPRDLIYCEEIPNTTEAILVIVKSGSVYLDGTFPKESIPDELIVFQTQQNNFEIYLYGNVPISQTEEAGKFTFDASAVKSFTILDNPVFAKLPLVKQFQLQLVDVTLKGQGIGGFPAGQVLVLLIVIALVWAGYMVLSARKQLPTAIVNAVNPYQAYLTQLISPDPVIEVQRFANAIMLLYTIPGWEPVSASYSKGSVRASVKSIGLRSNTLFDWAAKNRASVEVMPDGFYVTLDFFLANRPPPSTMYELKYVIANFMDKLSYVIPGNNLSIGTSINRGKYIETPLTIKFSGITPTTLNLIGQILNAYPFVLSGVNVTLDIQGLTGTIVLTALGS